MSLYFQPSPNRSNDDSLPTAPDQGVDVAALINQLINRIESAEKKIEYKVDSNALAKILLTDRDIVIAGDQVNIVGQLNIADWVRDISGNVTGGVDVASLTRITGGKVQTGIIESFNWSTTAGSQINLDTGTIVTGGSVSPKFSVSSAGVLTCQSAVVTGTLTAGSFIQSSVQLDDEFGITLAELAAGADIQTALTAGVTNILAGIGTDFRLNVDTVNALITLQHKDAVFLGTAPAGSNKPALGITSSGIGIGYNRSSDGAWQTRITLDASGNVAITGTLTAGSVITNSVTVDGVALSTISSRALSGYNIQQALEVSGSTVLKGVLVPTDAGALKTGTITWNSTTGALTGGTGVAITEYGIIGAAAGVATFTLNASTGALTVKGDITGGSNINITGQGVFAGAYTTASYNASIHANTSGSATNGILTKAGSGGYALVASATSPAGNGILAQASGAGRYAGEFSGVSSAGGIFVTGASLFTGNVNVGSLTVGSSSLVSNLNADMLDGYHATSLCRIVVPNTGTCTVSGGGFNLVSTVSGVQTRGNGSNGIIIESISDARLKNNIADEELGLDFINKLRPCTFGMNGKSGRFHGFIHQDARVLLDDEDMLAPINSNGIGGFDYNGVTSPIVKAIQELSVKIRRIENERTNSANIRQ